ncbi:hypothetical protein [Halocynthiibacter sp.]|uniref:hypothetical protein n=1 Tax=Halocynthiibacter sp. TaxID=1979210 RepID=UPI003C581F3D
MPLHILAPMVVVGLIIAWGAMRFAGCSQDLHFNTEGDARLHWLRHRPGAKPRDIIVAADGRAALVEVGSGLWLLRSFGIDSVIHHLGTAQVSAAKQGLTLAFPEYDDPKARLTLTPEECTIWQARINAHQQETRND